VSTTTARLSVLLLTEDGSPRADEVLRLLLVKLLGHLAPGAVTRDDATWWEPASADARDIVQANSWKNPRRRDRIRFLQYIAAKLTQEQGFVFFHVDGDRAYGERATSENLQKFETLIREPVKIILERPPAQRRERRRLASDSSAGDIRHQLDKLILLMPFYSIETWLFQNTDVASRLCPGTPRCRHGCAEKLAAWRRERGALDEVIRPKLELCLGARHNIALVKERYPLDEVLEAKKSLHDALDALRSCSALVRVLGERMPHWQR
jgi:hypothetical protein